MSITVPLNEIPLILSGPMLRRVESRSVSVFVALKHSRVVALSIHDGDTAQAPIKFEGYAQTVALGRYMHVAVVTATTDGAASGLAPGELYGYNLTFQQPVDKDPADVGQSLTTLADHGLLHNDFPLGYESGLLPTFALPAIHLGDLNLVHGSCRKPHGGGHDMLAVLDRILAADRHPLRRPHQLLLTGDQVYVDDVSLCLLHTIRATAHMLLAWNEPERIPFDLGTGPGQVSFDDPAVRPGSARKSWVMLQPGYTSDHDEGHLMFLGEYYLMYLMAWSDVLWPRTNGDLTPGSPPFPSEYTLSTPEDALPLEDWGQYYQTAGLERSNVLNYARTLRHVRRALANVPSYMIFDDHEVTDDWYLHGQWDLTVRNNSAGRRLMRNALIAYAIFQDWGNQPEQYAAGAGLELLQRVRFDGASGKTPLHDQPDDLDCHLGIQPSGSPCPNVRLAWHYRIAWDAHQIIVLDTRTCRAYSKVPKGNSGLLTADAQHWQLGRYAPGDGLETVVVSPAPFIGVPLLEEAVQKLYAHYKGPEAADSEAWIGNRPLFEAFLSELAAFGRVILLSGDVHYAFSNSVAYFRDDHGQAPARIVQFCASSLKNEDKMTRLLGQVGNVFPAIGWLGFSDGLQAPLAQDLKSAMLIDIGQMSFEPATDLKSLIASPDLAQIYFNLIIYDRLSQPAVIPSSGWISDPAFAIVKALADTGMGSQWRYGVTFARDDRVLSEREGELASLNEDLPPIDGETRAHILDDAREIVGYSNIARIHFKLNETGSATHVTQQLFWNAHSPDGGLSDILMTTRHRVPYTPPSADERPEVTQ